MNFKRKPFPPFKNCLVRSCNPTVCCKRVCNCLLWMISARDPMEVSLSVSRYLQRERDCPLRQCTKHFRGQRVKWRGTVNKQETWFISFVHWLTLRHLTSLPHISYPMWSLLWMNVFVKGFQCLPKVCICEVLYSVFLKDDRS